MNKQIIITASLLGALAVVSGAFGAHGLKNHLAPPQLEVWQTAVHYQFYHVLALLFLCTLTGFNVKSVNTIYYLFTVGIIFFSGSLYLLACRDLLGWSWIKFFGPITPIGGLLFIGGWVMLAITAYKQLK
ncbi:MAG: DUF423 domain-containing protein [Sphingobacteriaceae bacterium]|nr:MAG: DUF423 domain-containing protein [Sphingobacteriaceae bacterium]